MLESSDIAQKPPGKPPLIIDRSSAQKAGQRKSGADRNHEKIHGKDSIQVVPITEESEIFDTNSKTPKLSSALMGVVAQYKVIGNAQNQQASKVIRPVESEFEVIYGFESADKGELLASESDAANLIVQKWYARANNDLIFNRHNFIKLAASNLISPDLRLFVWLYLSESYASFSASNQVPSLNSIAPGIESPAFISSAKVGQAHIQYFYNQFDDLAKSICNQSSAKDVLEDSWDIFLKYTRSLVSKDKIFDGGILQSFLNMRYLIVPICKHVDESIASIEKIKSESHKEVGWRRELKKLYEKSIKPFALNYKDEKTRPKFFRQAISFILVKNAMEKLQYRIFYSNRMASKDAFTSILYRLTKCGCEKISDMMSKVSTCRND